MPGESVTAILAAAAAAITPPMIHNSGRRERRRGPFSRLAGAIDTPPREDIHPKAAACSSRCRSADCLRRPWSRLSPLGTCAAAQAAVVCVADSPPTPIAARPPGRRSGRGGGRGVACVPGAAYPVRGEVSRANARMIDSGSQFAVGWSVTTSASRPAAVGRRGP